MNESPSSSSRRIFAFQKSDESMKNGPKWRESVEYTYVLKRV